MYTDNEDPSTKLIGSNNIKKNYLLYTFKFRSTHFTFCITQNVSYSTHNFKAWV